jgi:hypothetical protein
MTKRLKEKRERTGGAKSVSGSGQRGVVMFSNAAASTIEKVSAPKKELRGLLKLFVFP